MDEIFKRRLHFQKINNKSKTNGKADKRKKVDKNEE